MRIYEVTDNKRDYMELLFLADEQEDMIDRYLDKGTMYVIDDNGVKGECIVTDEGEGVLEIKNIATVPESHGKGYGRHLINYLSEKYAGQYTTLQVGTGDSPLTIPFYEKCGFRRHHIIKNFFLDNYDHPIFEEGIQLVDMVYLRKEIAKVLKTQRLILRRWKDSDADDLFKYASDPDVGPIAGWPPHRNIDESKDVIKNVLNGKEAYAICLKDDGKAIGAIELKLNGHTDLTDRDDECEMGYWLGKPFWGQGIMSEAVKEMLRHAFLDLGMQRVWIGYYEGNTKSKRVQEKCGFKYQWRSENVDVPLMHEKRTGHVSLMTKEDWLLEKTQNMKFKTKVEKAGLEDIDVLVELRLDYLVEDNGSIDKNDAERIREALPDYYRKHLNKDLFAYVIREEKMIVSCAFLLVIEKPMSPAFINGKTGTVLNVFTRESCRRKGYARKIMDVLLAEAKDMGLVTIDLKSTEDGYLLYRSVGFQDDLSKYHLMKWKNQ